MTPETAARTVALCCIRTGRPMPTKGVSEDVLLEVRAELDRMRKHAEAQVAAVDAALGRCRYVGGYDGHSL